MQYDRNPAVNMQLPIEIECNQIEKAHHMSPEVVYQWEVIILEIILHKIKQKSKRAHCYFYIAFGSDR